MIENAENAKYELIKLFFHRSLPYVKSIAAILLILLLLHYCQLSKVGGEVLEAIQLAQKVGDCRVAVELQYRSTEKVGDTAASIGWKIFGEYRSLKGWVVVLEQNGCPTKEQ